MSLRDQILSEYIDGEVPEPWRTTVTKSIEHDDEVADRYRRLRRVQVALHESADLTDVDEARARERILHEVLRRAETVHPRAPGRVTLPTGLVAAAATVLVALVGWVGYDLTHPDPVPLPVAGGVYDEDLFRVGPSGSLVADRSPDELTISVNDIEQLLAILDTQGQWGRINIKLPETRQFEFIGEPQLLKATDYVPED